MKYIAWNKGAKIYTTTETMEEMETKMANRKNYIITDGTGEKVIKAVENGKVLKGRAAKIFETEYTLY